MGIHMAAKTQGLPYHSLELLEGRLHLVEGWFLLPKSKQDKMNYIHVAPGEV